MPGTLNSREVRPSCSVSSLTSVAVQSLNASNEPPRSFILGDWSLILDGGRAFFDSWFEFTATCMPRGGFVLQVPLEMDSCV